MHGKLEPEERVLREQNHEEHDHEKEVQEEIAEGWYPLKSD
jgi:hypothetical protein|tara:strand:+ start:10823 stop:10945 length:123 start_codon:yes stop_codon:yes gene_type:complete